MDVIPSIFGLREVGALDDSDGGAFTNVRLRPGEIISILAPSHPENLSKKFYEYDVLVQHRENDTAVTKIYRCWHVNTFGGLADYLVYTLRQDDVTSRQGIAQDAPTIDTGFGSKVLILCVNGEHSQAVILSGERDERDSDKNREALGHHLEFSFNGVVFKINNDGGYEVAMNGKTRADGKAHAERNILGSGTTLKASADGTWQVFTPEKKQSLTIDHVNGTMTFEADKTYEVVSDRINHGQDADEPVPCGNLLVDLLGDILDELATETHMSPSGMTGPPKNAAKYKAIKARLNTVLSEFVFVKKSAR